MIRWQDNRERVEPAVKMLIRDLHPTAQGIDGSGGDDGRDIRWDSPDGLVIFEVKSYTERLSKSQKRGIRNSLTKAAKHNPVRWVLIQPLEPTPSEERWFDELRMVFPEIQLEWRGRDWLNLEFSKREYLVRAVEGPLYVLAERARELGHEQAVMANGIIDAVDRLGIFSKRINELSSFWKVDYSTGPEGIVFAYSEKFPGASSLDPVNITPIYSFPPDDPIASDVERQLKRVLEYGGEVSIPGQFVQEFNIDASEETRRAFGWDTPTKASRVEIKSIENNAGLPVGCTIKVHSSDGTLLTALPVRLTRRVGGSKGVTVSGSDHSGILTASFLIGGDDQRATGLFDMALASPFGLLPHDTRPVADFILALQAGNSIEFKIGYATFGFADVTRTAFEEESPIARLIAALDDLQRHFQQQFALPEGLNGRDLAELEMLVTLVRDGRAQWPYRTLKMNFRADRVREIVASEMFRSGNGALIADFENFGLTYAGHPFNLGHTRFVAPRMELVNKEEIEAKINTGADPEGRWKCIDDEHIYIQRLSPEEWESFRTQVRGGPSPRSSS